MANKEITVSLVMLTMNRLEAVERSLSENLLNAGYPIREIVHVDNGSKDGFADWFADKFNPAVQVRHATNLGVPRGYNRGLALATSSHIVITGCDRVLPENWLKTFVDVSTRVPTGAVSAYTNTERHLQHRQRGEQRIVNGVTILPCVPFEARFHSREFLFDVGFFREDFGLYGYEDCEWAERAERVARDKGLFNYIMLGFEAKHLADDDSMIMPNGQTYRAYKDFFKRQDIYDRASRESFPYYNPFFRVEKNFNEGD